jgi:hypothetical protein
MRMTRVASEAPSCRVKTARHSAASEQEGVAIADIEVGLEPGRVTSSRMCRMDPRPGTVHVRPSCNNTMRLSSIYMLQKVGVDVYSLLYNNTEYAQPPGQVRVGRGSALAGYWPSDQQEFENIDNLKESNNHENNRQKRPINTIIKVTGR